MRGSPFSSMIISSIRVRKVDMPWSNLILELKAQSYPLIVAWPKKIVADEAILKVLDGVNVKQSIIIVRDYQ